MNTEFFELIVNNQNDDYYKGKDYYENAIKLMKKEYTFNTLKSDKDKFPINKYPETYNNFLMAFQNGYYENINHFIDFLEFYCEFNENNYLIKTINSLLQIIKDEKILKQLNDRLEILNHEIELLPRFR